jgi:hypothetical protein
LAAGLFVSQLSAAMLSRTGAALVAWLVQFHRYTAEGGETWHRRRFGPTRRISVSTPTRSSATLAGGMGRSQL